MMVANNAKTKAKYREAFIIEWNYFKDLENYFLDLV